MIRLGRVSSGQSEAPWASDEAKICDNTERWQEISDGHAKR